MSCAAAFLNGAREALSLAETAQHVVLLLLLLVLSLLGM
jgi:hypothetical protein